MAGLKSQQQLYDDFKNEVQGDAPELTDWVPGSTNDILGGTVSSAARELELLIVEAFRKTNFDTADGPEVTGGPDYLQDKAVDTFGPEFARPGATSAIGDVTFSRPTAAAGSVTILAGTIIKTLPDANGVAQRYATLIDETMGVGVLTINASVRAVAAGSGGNADIGMVTVIETALTDNTLLVTNAAAFTGGAPAMNDATYREFLRNLVQTLKGASLSAIEAAAKTVAGVETATGIENQKAVIEYDIATGAPLAGATFFYIPNSVLYIADANGTASDALVAAVVAKIASTRAAGVRVPVLGASALPLNWFATVVLNPSGPNYAALSLSTQMIRESMANYIRSLPIGTGFSRDLARTAMLAIYGPSGSQDITSFQTTVPAGDVAASGTQKLIPGTIGTN